MQQMKDKRKPRHRARIFWNVKMAVCIVEFPIQRYAYLEKYWST